MKTNRQVLQATAIVALICLGHVASAQREIIHVTRTIFSRTANADAQEVTTFGPRDHVIYCLAEVSKPSAAAKYKFNWSYTEPEQSQPKAIFTEELTNQTSNQVVSKFSSSQDLPPGQYKVFLWVDGHPGARRFFTVTKD